MRHESIRIDSPIEFINVTPMNPLISRCQIKVCYVGEQPNRNKSIITKEVARQMANTLPGCPIVGFYNSGKEDFEEHSRQITISNGKFQITDLTRPYGFVDMNAKVWFQKFLDDGVEHEYLVTEGYIWNGVYPESQRILDKGNNQSMELYQKTLNAQWTKDDNGKPQFFIINEAVIQKLCILGEESEPCFEGASITKLEFSFDDGFKEQLFSMMKELKQLLDEGGTKVFKNLDVTIGDSLWTAIENATEYSIVQICEDENEQKFAVVQDADNKYYRLNFSVVDDSYEMGEIVEYAEYTPAETPQFSDEDIASYKKKKDEEEEDKNGEDGSEKKEEEPEGEKKPEEDDKGAEQPEDDDEDDDEEKKKNKKTKYSLDEVVEYQDLLVKFADLESKYNDLLTEKTNLENQLAPLAQFKADAERKDKEEMIKSFYMLSDEDKADVVANIDTYSLDDIEAKLSIICVRNKVSFDLDDNNGPKDPITYNLDNDPDEDAGTPAWVKAVLDTAKTLN